MHLINSQGTEFIHRLCLQSRKLFLGTCQDHFRCGLQGRLVKLGLHSLNIIRRRGD